MAELQELLNRLVTKSAEQDDRILQQQNQMQQQQSQITELLQTLSTQAPVRVDLQQSVVA